MTTSISIDFTGADNSTACTDSSGKTWTFHGGAKILDNALYCDGIDSYIDTPHHADFAVGSDDFSIRFWVKRTGNDMAMFGDGDSVNGWGCAEGYIGSTNNIQNGIYYNTAASFLQAPVYSISTNWHYVRLIRFGNGLYQYVDGISCGTPSDATGITADDSASKFAIGREGEYDGLYFNGYIDDFIFTKGDAEWANRTVIPARTAPKKAYSPTFNVFDQMESPSITLCYPNKTELYSLVLAYNIKNTIRYNAISELEFDYSRSSDGGLTTNSAYDYLKGKMLISVDDNVDDAVFYVINSAEEDLTGSIPLKHVVAMSLECEMFSRRLTGFSGTYAFADTLQKALDLIPTWTIGSIAPSLLTLYRTFDINNSTVYNFLTKEMEKAYGCIFEFDTYNRTVSAIANTIPVSPPNSNIFLSFDNLVSNIQFKEITEEICTALYCYGGQDLDIHNVNPLGGNAIYNFDYFKTTEWMSQELIDALGEPSPPTGWEGAVETQKPIYTAYLTDLEEENTKMIELDGEMAVLNAQLASMIETYNARVEGGLDTSEIEAQIDEQYVLIASKNSEIGVVQNAIDELQINLRKIVHSLFFTSQISFHNFEEDVDSMYATIVAMQTNWTTEYNADSTYPGFLPATLVAAEPEIYDLLLDSKTGMKVLLDYLAAGLSAYPPSAGELTNIDTYLDTEIASLTSLYTLLQSIIPNTNTTESINLIITTLKAYLEIIYYSENMTYALYLELCSYIYENTYTNENIVMTDLMTPVDVQVQSEDLYTQSEGVLVKSSQPRYEFSGSFSNFIALKDFSAFTDELDMGGSIYIQKSDGTVIEALLLELVINYDNPTDFSMTFSNSFRLDNSSFIYGDFLGDAAQLGSNISGATFGVEGTTTLVEGGGSYVLLPATDTTLGGVIVGNLLSITSEGVLSADVQGGGAGSFIGTRAGLTTSFTIGATSGIIILNNDSTDGYYDVGSNYNTTTGSYVVPQDGYYHIIGHLTLGDTESAYQYAVKIFVDGVSIDRSEQPGTDGGLRSLEVNDVYYLTTGQVVTLRWATTHGGLVEYVAGDDEGAGHTYFEINLTTGAQGEVGDTGIKGDTGQHGDTGTSGAAVDKGDTGITGDTGQQGDTGIGEGTAGDTGVAGQGDTGIQGDTGASGGSLDFVGARAQLYTTTAVTTNPMLIPVGDTGVSGDYCEGVTFSNNSFTTLQDGYYHIIGHLTLDATSDLVDYAVKIFVDGSTINRSQAIGNNEGGFLTLEVNDVYYLTTGQVVSLQIAGGDGESVVGADDGFGYTYLEVTLVSEGGIPTASDTVLGGVKIGSGLDINAGVLSTHDGDDGWISITDTWTYYNANRITNSNDISAYSYPLGCKIRLKQANPFSIAYTNDPAAPDVYGEVQFEMGDTSGFRMFNNVTISSGAGTEEGMVIDINTDASITVTGLTLNHDTTDPLITFSGYKYFYFVGGYYGRIYLTGGTDYILADETITDISYNQHDAVFEFPQWFNYLPNVSSTSGSISAYAVNNACFTITGNLVTICCEVDITTNGTGSGNLSFGFPPVIYYWNFMNGCGTNINTNKALSIKGVNIYLYDGSYPVSDDGDVLTWTLTGKLLDMFYD